MQMKLCLLIQFYLVVALLVCTSGLAADFEFVVIGDTRPRFESESFRPFENLITKINSLKPALIINLGDLIYGYGVPSKEKQWNKYQAVVQTIEQPYYQVPGNHDTHSKAARRVYERRFGKFYESFDYGDCHFVLLDTTEKQQWGDIEPAQFEWLKRDLEQTRAQQVFVFTHFPVWEPERVTPKYYDFWANKLHPLFKASRVKAVFAGHYHAYGPTREFDGIRYYITGGGGAELRPEYKKAGGEFHFMKVKVQGGRFDVRIETGRGELTDPEADVMGGLLFAARHVSRIGILAGEQDLKAGVTFNVSVANPYLETMAGEASWIFDSSAFSVEPPNAALHISGGATHQYRFTLRAVQANAMLESLPRLQFNVTAGHRVHRFHREVRLLHTASAAYRDRGPKLDGQLDDWTGVPQLKMGGGSAPEAELASCLDEQNLYLAVTVPVADISEAKELGFSDELQVGLARRLSETDFDNDFLRLGFNSGKREVYNRTPGRKVETAVPGIHLASRVTDRHKTFEIAVPLQLIAHRRSTLPSQLIIDVSFPVPDGDPNVAEPAEPAANTLAYRVRYGSDSLVPVYFVELTLPSGR